MVFDNEAIDAERDAARIRQRGAQQAVRLYNKLVRHTLHPNPTP